MTETKLAELLEAIEKRVGKDIAKIVEEELRDRIAIGTLPPANFPAGLIRDGDYYDKTCASKLGWAGAHEIDYDALEGV